MKFNFKTKCIALVSIIGLFVLLIAISPFLGKSAQTTRQDNQALFPAFKTTLANSISFTTEHNNVNLVKEGDQWLVAYGTNVVKADTQTVDNFLNAFKDLKQGRIIENKASDLSQYELTESDRTRIEIVDARSNSYIILVGKENDTYTKQYYQLENSESVWETTLPYEFSNTSSKEWVSLELFPDFQSGISVISFGLSGNNPLEDAEEGNYNYKLDLITDSEGKNAWTFIDGSESVDGNSVDATLRTLVSASLYDYRFDLDNGVTGLDKPAIIVSITGSDAQIRTLAIGNKVESNDRYYAKFIETNQLFELSKSTLNGFLKPQSEFLSE